MTSIRYGILSAVCSLSPSKLVRICCSLDFACGFVQGRLIRRKGGTLDSWIVWIGLRFKNGCNINALVTFIWERSR